MTRKDNKGRNLKTGEYQRSDGRFEYRYIDPKTGKTNAVYETDLKKLREQEKEIQRDIDDGIAMSPVLRSMTVNELFQRYLGTRELTETTRHNYEYLWNLHVREMLGSMKVVDVKTSHIRNFYTEKSKQGLSEKTIKLFHTLLAPAFQLAVEDDLIRKNPAAGKCSGYGRESVQRQALSAEEQDRLLRFVGAHPVYAVYEPLLQIMIGTACRAGEIIGLTWADVDIPGGDVRIDHQLVYKDYGDGDGYRFHCVPPKTKAGIRVIPMTRQVREAFLTQRKRQLAQDMANATSVDGLRGFVFTGRNGLPLMPSALNNILYNIVKAYNKAEMIQARIAHRQPELMSKFSAHVLRHTGCTRMAETGMDPKVLQYLMGHNDITVTMGVYNHISDRRRIEQEINRLDQYAVNENRW